MQNEPNLAKRDGAEGPTDEGESRKTNPIFDHGLGTDLRRSAPIVQNEANFAGLGGPIMQNEPNSSIADCEFRIADWEQSSGEAMNRAKRTQFPPSR